MLLVPQTERLLLSNGIKCITAFIPEAPLTCIDIWCKAGSFYEESNEHGMAHFLEHMVFKGSKTLKEGEFDQQIEYMGGSSNAATGYDDVHYHILIPPDKTIEAINLLTSLVLSPSLNESAYSLEREVVLEEIAQHKDQPDERIFDHLLEKCWFNQAYGRPILGNINCLKESTPETMRIFHNRLYNSENIVLSIAGNLPQNIKEILERTELMETKKSQNKTINFNNTKNHKFHKGKINIEVDRLEVSRLIIAWPLPEADKQIDILGADIATTLLAEGRRSMLVSRLREELKIVESIDMDVTSLEKGGLIILEATCNEEDLERVEKETNKIIEETSKLEISNQAMSRAKKLVTNGIYFSLESSSSVAAISGYQALWNRSTDLKQPLHLINELDEKSIKKNIMQKLDTDEKFVMRAVPVKN